MFAKPKSGSEDDDLLLIDSTLSRVRTHPPDGRARQIPVGQARCPMWGTNCFRSRSPAQSPRRDLELKGLPGSDVCRQPVRPRAPLATVGAARQSPDHLGVIDL
jgi:hypothetical protein